VSRTVLREAGAQLPGLLTRLWRSVKYENIYLWAYEDGTQFATRTDRVLRLLQYPAHSPSAGLSDPGRCLLRPHRVQPRGMIGGQPQHTQELLPLRVRLPGVGAIDEETEREIINKAGRST
jgi:hypothetical protein